MKRIIKKPDSKVLSDKLKYKKGQAENNKRLREALEEEQDYKIPVHEKILKLQPFSYFVCHMINQTINRNEEY
jgi:hypothetical protein